jgi:beta-xylosidase
VPVINQKDEITVKSGQGFGIDASDTYDPDGDSFSYLWFDYPEAGTYKKAIKISPENYNNIWITAPDVETKETVHIILKITDKGTPQLSRYKRIIVTILQK